MKHEPLAYRMRDFTEVTGVGRTKAYELIREGKLKAVKVGGRTLIPFVEAEKLIKGGV